MSREVPEWIAKNDNTAIPPRVKARVYLLAGRRCGHCTRFIDGSRLVGEYDHVVPLILGGAHRESNLQLLCSECHAVKTKFDIKLKAKVARVRKRHLGIKKPSKFACSRNSKFKKKIDGSVVLR
jgi:5-methylcytosine-specific restriction endonuclease McrA